MVIVHTLRAPHGITLTPNPLTREAFSPFGTVLANPAPSTHPSTTSPNRISRLPYGAKSANQGTAIQYPDICPTTSLYSGSPSRVEARPRMSMFVCAARGDVVSGNDKSHRGRKVEIGVLERHPFTTQTFTPLSTSGPRGPPASEGRAYLVVVAPSLPPSDLDSGLPVIKGGTLPGSGLPDLGRLQAFIARGDQAVTYGAGTWHAPMIALGSEGTAVDFVVFQFVNGVEIEDCQEVVLDGQRERNIVVDLGRAGQSAGRPKL